MILLIKMVISMISMSQGLITKELWLPKSTNFTKEIYITTEKGYKDIFNTTYLSEKGVSGDPVECGVHKTNDTNSSITTFNSSNMIYENETTSFRIQYTNFADGGQNLSFY